MKCKACQGSGSIVLFTSRQKCKECNGTGSTGVVLVQWTGLVVGPYTDKPNDNRYKVISFNADDLKLGS